MASTLAAAPDLAYVGVVTCKVPTSLARSVSRSTCRQAAEELASDEPAGIKLRRRGVAAMELIGNPAPGYVTPRRREAARPHRRAQSSRRL